LLLPPSMPLSSSTRPPRSPPPFPYTTLFRSLKGALGEEARALGFDVVAVTRPDAIGRAGDGLAQFLAAGHHGDMDWLAATAERRGRERNPLDSRPLPNSYARLFL